MHSLDLSRPARDVVALIVVVLLAGCESAIPSPAPPPPAPPPSIVADSADAPRRDSRAVAFIMPHPDRQPIEIALWEQTLRQEGNRNKIIVEVAQPGEKDPPNRQGELIRDAVARGVGALVVVPDPGSAEALVHARDSGATVVLVNHSIDHKGKPFPLVTFEPAAKSAEALVEAAIKAAREFGLSTKGPALIIRRKIDDSHSQERADALETALKKANVEVLPRLQFKDEFKDLKDQLDQAIAAHPKLPMILIADDEAVRPVAELRNGMYSGDRFAFAVYATESKFRRLLTSGQCAAIADVNNARLARKALQVLMEIRGGKTSPDRLDLELPILRPTRNDNDFTIPVPRGSSPN